MKDKLKQLERMKQAGEIADYSIGSLEAVNLVLDKSGKLSFDLVGTVLIVPNAAVQEVSVNIEINKDL